MDSFRGDPASEGSKETPVESPPVPSPRAKILKYYAILPSASYSLRNAASLLGLPEEELRRAILLDGVEAEETSDDRQYLLEGRALLSYVRRLRPHEEIRAATNGESVLWGVAILVVIPLLAAVLFLLLGAGSSSSSERPPHPAPKFGLEANGWDW